MNEHVRRLEELRARQAARPGPDRLVRDAFAWLKARALQRVQNRETAASRFVVFGQGRCGSTLLTSLLDSNRWIQCEGELLANRHPYPEAWLAACADSAPADVRAFGFHLKPWHIDRIHGLDPVAFVRRMVEVDYSFVHLRRENIFLQSLSQVKLHTERLVHSTGPHRVGNERFHIDPDFLVYLMREKEQGRAVERACLEAIATPVATVTYELHLSDAEKQAATCARLFDFLRVERSPVTTKLVKVSPRNWRDGVDNEEEVVAAVAAAGFADYLNMAQ